MLSLRNSNRKLTVDFFPGLQPISNDVINSINDPQITPKQLAQIISKDQGLVLKILAIANSPAYGFFRKVSTVEMAISLLGVEMIKDLVLSFSIQNISNNRDSMYFSQKAFNNHALLTGFVSQILANDFLYDSKNEAFVAGLLHDVGIAIINSFFSKEFRLICELKFYRKICQSKAEELILGKNHSEIGAAVLEKWYFSELLIDVVKNHHIPSQSKVNPKLSAIVHLADHITSTLQSPFLINDELEELDLEVLKILRIPDESFLYEIINSIKLITNSNFKELMCME